jgi:hypothetical protein
MDNVCAAGIIDGDARIELTEVLHLDSQVRFRVSAEIWLQALGLDAFVAYVVSLMK